MKTLLDYLDSDDPMVDCGEARFFDDVAGRLHDRSVYDIIKWAAKDMHPTLITALLETLDEHDLDLIDQCTDWFEIKVLKGRMLDGRKERAKPKNVTHRLNYPIDEVLDDYLTRRKGKHMEAKRQLKKRFDGLDHDMQEKVMMAFMEQGGPSERNFIYDKLYGEEFWVDAYTPLVQHWWDSRPEPRLAKVVVKYCPPAYILKHLEELEGLCNYATLCLRTGLDPKEEKLNPWTYLYVLKTSGGQLEFHQGRRLVLKQVRAYLYEEGEGEPVHSIYDIPYVKRMMAYLGEMGLVEEIMALDAFDWKMRSVPRAEWGTAVIKAIEELYGFPPFVYREV
jgi:hypothetical protein